MSEQLRRIFTQVSTAAFIRGSVVVSVCWALAHALRRKTEATLLAVVVVFALISVRAALRGLIAELYSKPDQALSYYTTALADVLLSSAALISRWLFTAGQG